MILPWVARDKDGERSKSVLAPFRDGSTKPVLDKYGTVPDMLAVSHAGDANLATAPRRLSIRGTFFSDFFPELLLSVWEKYVAFTEGNDDVKASAVLWDLTSPAKLAEVDVDATALKTREPHYWMAVQGRRVLRLRRIVVLDLILIHAGPRPTLQLLQRASSQLPP